MSDAVNLIDNATLGTPGCASYVYTERSYQPFIRDVFHQFSETRTGGAFTFMTGIGGFLREFLDGYSGMRWDTNDVALKLRTITLRWGRQWPVAPGPNIPPPPAPVTVLRPASYAVFVSSNGHSWRRVAFVNGHAGRVLDTVHLNGVKARFVRVRLTAPSSTKFPLLQELTATG